MLIINNYLKKLFRLEFVQVSLVFMGLAVLFLSDPILNFSKTYYSPTDMLQGTPVFKVGDQPPTVHNAVLGDDIYAYLPWLELGRRSLQQGELPLWNPYNSGGRPLLANMQSSLFYPSHWPAYLFGERFGLIARCFLHLYLAGLGAYYFFRALKVWAGAALAGAVAFMFGGMMVVWLYNELSATFLLFPLLLLVIERRLSMRTAPLRFVIELGLVVMLQILGGHPETIYLSVSLATCYLLYRLATDRANWPGWRKKIHMVELYILGGLWGVILGAIQLFPFAEYFLNSAALVGRGGSKLSFVLPPQYMLSFILPAPFGSPVYGGKLDFTRPNYSEVSGAYIGPTVLFLALCALWIARRRPLTWFFWLANLIILQLVYDLGPLHNLFMQVQPVTVYYTRLMGYAAFFLVALMAFTLDGLYRSAWLVKARLSLQLSLVAAGGGLFLAGFGALFWWFSQSGIVPFERPKVMGFETKDFQNVAGLFVVSLVGLALIMRGRRLKQVGALVLLAVLFCQLGLYGKSYRSAVPQEYFYPDTPVTAALQGAGGRVASAGNPGLFPAEANIWYGIEQVNGYDSLEVRWYEQLRKASTERWPDWDNPGAFNLFNVKQVLVPSNAANFQGPVAKNAPQLRRAAKFKGVNIFNNTQAQPPYRMVYQAVVQPEGEATQSLLGGQINPLEKVIFIQGQAPDSLKESTESITPPPVKIIKKSFNRATLQVTNPRPGFLYLDQTYFPGWEASVNGQSARLYRANVAFTALPVQAGDLIIELSYNPLSFRLGALLTVLGLLVTVLAASRRRIRRYIVTQKAS